MQKNIWVYLIGVVLLAVVLVRGYSSLLAIAPSSTYPLIVEAKIYGNVLLTFVVGVLIVSAMWVYTKFK